MGQDAAAEAGQQPHHHLADEHEQSLRVLHRIRAAMRQVYEIAFDVALELYPDAWRELRPRLISVASWVGYDTDGRADIDWSTTFSKRLAVQLDQLAYSRDRVAALRGNAREAALQALLELLEARLALAVKSAQDELEPLAEWAALAPVDDDAALVGRAGALGGGHGGGPAGEHPTSMRRAWIDPWPPD